VEKIKNEEWRQGRLALTGLKAPRRKRARRDQNYGLY
jgi:hypothetical protein